MLKLTCISLSDRSQSEIPKHTVICLGNFDGVHSAHRQLLKRSFALQKELSILTSRCVFCFFEPSWTAFSKEPPLLLSTMDEKLNMLEACGIEYAILCDFSCVKDFSPERFVNEILLDGCHCEAAVCGFNYRFGKMGSGDPDRLKMLLGKPVFVEQEYLLDGETVSSTRIRELLKNGNVKRAASLLGAPYMLSSAVIHGKALGKALGFPTLNQEIATNKLAPRNGVYLTRCTIEGIQYYGVTNVGVHPTVDVNAARNCETYLPDVDVNAYDKEASIAFLDFIRPEQRFESIDALCEQMKKDVAQARELLSNQP